MTHHSACPTGQVIVCDINPDMLEVGKSRAIQMGIDQDQISWTQGDAMKLPFEDEQFDAYTIAFGIRNVVRIEEV